MSTRGTSWLTAGIFLLTILWGAASAQEAREEALILGGSSIWRYHYTLKPPVIRKDGKLEKIKMMWRGKVSGKWLDFDTPLPPRDWKEVGFNDVGWNRKPLVDPNSSWVAHLALRGKFSVLNPRKAGDLKLSVTYRGGIVVYLNGREIARGHLKRNAKPDDLADDYPTGNFKQIRKLTDIPVPSGALRRGTNVLALEVHRSAHPESSVRLIKGGTSLEAGTCGVMQVRLTAANGETVVPNVSRSRGVQVWNSDSASWDLDVDRGDPNEAPGPIRIIAPCGGVGSGKIVVGSDEPIKGLRAVVGALVPKGGGRGIPVSAVQVRYALPTVGGYGVRDRYTARPSSGGYNVFPYRFDALAEVPLDEIPVRVRDGGSRRRPANNAAMVWGAVQPVWVTVAVPVEAEPGDYLGTLSLSVGDEKLRKVPIHLRVCAWQLAPPTEFSTFVDVIESPESVAMQYNVPLWSDEHFKLLERSFALLGQLGNRTCYIPLICETNQGNDESMVRWIRQDDGSTKHDFTVMKRYLDAVIKHQGRPTVVCFTVWDTYLEGGLKGRGIAVTHKPVMAERQGHQGKGPFVSVLDRRSGKVEKRALPMYSDPDSRRLWEPVMREIRRRMKKRGLQESMMLGCVTDQLPTRETVGFFSNICPDVAWVSHAHPFRRRLYDVPVGYHSGVTGSGLFAEDPTVGRMYGWQNKVLRTHFARNHRDWFSLTAWRFIPEINITGGQRGFSRIGGDFFKVLKDRDGRATGTLSARFPKSSWRHLDMATAILAPGRNGAVATVRFEMIREGLQECEARIFIEKTLTDTALRAKLGEPLAERLQTLLDNRWRNVRRALSKLRAQGIWTHYNAYRANGWWKAIPVLGNDWFVSSDWQTETEKLYEAAAEVEKKLNGDR